MQKVNPTKVASLDQYSLAVGSEMIEQLKKAAKPLVGKKIVEINSTAIGGGVAELLSSQIPMCQELGLNSEWYVIPPDDRFFQTTKGLHNCLQGECGLDSVLDFEYYQKYLRNVAQDLPKADLYILHDPQTLGLVPFLEGKKIIWRCHIDLTEADPSSLEWLQGYYPKFDKVIFSLDAYIHGLERSRVAIVHPSIDPLTPKNIKLSDTDIMKYIEKYGISNRTPFILQVSRFDKFKNPIGVIELYKLLLPQNPDLQCFLVGGYATDDPEGQEYFEVVKQKAKEFDNNRIKIISDASDLEVNALQQQASLVIQNSSREGFGLTVTEALWKKKIVFSRPVGGIALQIIHDRTGYYLSDNNKSNQALMDQVILRSYNYHMIGQDAHNYVKQNFVTPKMLTDYLDVYTEVINQ